MEREPEEMGRDESGGEGVRGQSGVDHRAALLLQQAEAIVQAGGPNMIEMFQEDEVIRENVSSGAWDFSVAYGYLLGRESVKKNGRKFVPSAVRSPNHANTRKSVASMSDREFDELDERLSRGEVFDPSR
jgi:hypothetical protein